ncbi:hypothetical protein Aca07nite_15480 [Actinoplanes capillaceus]|uniref:Uncharacterized protein n=1 Tax=Actinoplanes campanulatus TaxID=113559 RepID=A0ABQ3WDL3_9ACTN|nr:hypothetical protein Aca07nite_15480 [Actinoplanes capillaceus]
MVIIGQRFSGRGARAPSVTVGGRDGFRHIDSGSGRRMFRLRTGRPLERSDWSEDRSLTEARTVRLIQPSRPAPSDRFARVGEATESRRPDGGSRQVEAIQMASEPTAAGPAE